VEVAATNGHPASVEDARRILSDLIRHRQHLTAEGGDAGLLEANRLGIVYWQLQLARAIATERAEPSN
jgi:hypothetical protein